MSSLKEADKFISTQIEQYKDDENEYWAFRGNRSKRDYVHGFFQYPAMMVSQMQRELIQIIRHAQPSVNSIFDPFVGSGTSMTEAMLEGMDFLGHDINPLAILVCKAKSGPFFQNKLEKKIKELFHRIEADDSINIDVNFPNLEKWFRQDVAIELSKIRRAIKGDTSKWSRRFFWVSLAETVRLTSNSRTSTYKLHIRPLKEIKERNLSPIQIFQDLSERNFKLLVDIKDVLDRKKFVKNYSFYKSNVKLELKDSRVLGKSNSKKYDLLITSPPYGDNKTTIPYGQFSYLPLQWINFKDIDDKVDKNCLKSTYEIDGKSLGGSLANVLQEEKKLCSLSESYKKILDNLKEMDREKHLKVTAFVRDLNKSLDSILPLLKENSYTIWTLGNRTVGGETIPLDNIVIDLLKNRNCTLITKFQRKIPSKRMAVKNKVSKTMRLENVVILRKGEK